MPQATDSTASEAKPPGTRESHLRVAFSNIGQEPLVEAVATPTGAVDVRVVDRKPCAH